MCYLGRFFIYFQWIIFLFLLDVIDSLLLTGLARLEPTPLKMVWLLVFRNFDFFKSLSPLASLLQPV